MLYNLFARRQGGAWEPLAHSKSIEKIRELIPIYKEINPKTTEFRIIRGFTHDIRRILKGEMKNALDNIRHDYA